MDDVKFVCKQTEKGGLETGESADGEHVKNEERKIRVADKL